MNHWNPVLGGFAVLHTSPPLGSAVMRYVPAGTLATRTSGPLRSGPWQLVYQPMSTVVRKVHRPVLLHVPARQSESMTHPAQRPQAPHDPPQSTSVSEPLRTWSSQRGGWHALPAHTPELHAVPHAPQLPGVVRRSVSQPFAAAPSQSPKFALQLATPHALAAHTPVALAGVHARPQRPQLVRVLRRFVSQPLAGMPSQSSKPVVHVLRQAPDTHAGTLFAGAGHTVPQDAQFVVLLRRSVSQPLAALPSQSPKFAAHVATPQAPRAQVPVALGGAQVRPQPPQCAVLVRRSTSQPLLESPSQSAKPVAQAYAQ